jgi:hypothetical protein
MKSRAITTVSVGSRANRSLANVSPHSHEWAAASDCARRDETGTRRRSESTQDCCLVHVQPDMSRFVVSLFVVSCVAGGALLLSGCGSVSGGVPETTASPSPAAIIDSGVEGMVVISPLQPVGGLPGASPNSKPAAAVAIQVRAAPAADKTTSAAPGPVLARGVAGSDGRFRIALPPGRYELTPESPSGRQLRPVAAIVTVLPNQFTTVMLQLDTGIR